MSSEKVGRAWISIKDRHECNLFLAGYELSDTNQVRARIDAQLLEDICFQGPELSEEERRTMIEKSIPQKDEQEERRLQSAGLKDTDLQKVSLFLTLVQLQRLAYLIEGEGVAEKQLTEALKSLKGNGSIVFRIDVTETCMDQESL
jgi:hypothetical protein